MLETLDKWDKALMVYLNTLHSPALDGTMIFLSAKAVWIPLYLLIIGIIIKIYRKKSIVVILIIISLIGATDFITSSIIKPLAKRERPCHDKEIQSTLYVPIGCGGTYGFVSSHSANTFALATILLLISRKKIWALLYLWAFSVAYSRIYLGVHYPGDIVCGAFIGIILGLLFFMLYKKLNKESHRSTTTN
ncbi:undecaprenyl pyrophosphate phosphatase [Sporocytophaga myxococcoides]|uniref:Undecaprenyl pyrophosphate phosphatase n=1 Tax=Sporocytophaga myxococcoides TaxID=153721 RepID=A0A098LL11_9BACT|nr:phosphatase PAP2 family protein [Sporocytophaga myxococcoides]GAL87691.1 undecaprenyl pyrophosphate phosphatase [Sporocytophaga myxococcoides]